jgi:tetratricopeptide (TPR) repeat protein
VPVRRSIIISLLLAGITLAIYWPARHYAVVFYDDTFFTDNPEVQSGLNAQSFRWALSAVVAANWHPVTTLSFVLTHQFFGTNAGAEHLVNGVIHALNAALLFLVLEYMTGKVKSGKRKAENGNGNATSENASARWDARPTNTTWQCAAAAALFAWHPLRVESVAWIAERKDVLCGFFVLLTMGAWTRHTNESGKPAWRSGYYWLALGCFAFSLLSKAMAVTLPFVLLLLDVWPLKRIQNSGFRIQNWKRLVWEKIPFFLLALIFSVVTFLVQRGDAATPSLQELGPGLRLENIIVSYWRYLGWSVWPGQLAMFYSFPYDSHSYLALWPGWVIVSAALLLGLVSVLCVRQLGRRPYLAVGWFWYLGMMVPVIGLVQVGSQGMADRYTYLPLIGPVISVVWLVAGSLQSLRSLRTATNVTLDPTLQRTAKALLATLLTLILAADIFLTRHQLQFWKNSEILSQHTIEVTGENTRAEYILGLSLERAGHIDEAMLHYRNAVSAQPRITDAFAAIGRLFSQQGNWAMAEKTYAAMLGDNPNEFAAHLGLAIALPHLGRGTEAAPQLQAALKNCPDSPDTLNNLAWTLATSSTPEIRDGAAAVKCAERACALTGYRETVMVGTLGAAYAEAGRFDEAVATAQKACALATGLGKTELLNINQQLLELYRQQQPYREPAGPADTNPTPGQPSR